MKIHRIWIIFVTLLSPSPSPFMALRGEAGAHINLILRVFPVLWIPGWVPISWSSLISKMFVCTSVLLPNKKKTACPCKRAAGHGPPPFSLSILSPYHKMGHRISWEVSAVLCFLLVQNLPHSLWHLTSNLKAQTVPGKRGLLLVFDFEHYKHSGFWEGMLHGKALFVPTKTLQMRDFG